MRDYGLNFDVRYFGTDNPATAVAERMPFVVQTNGPEKYVNIGIVSGAHGSHVAGIAAGPPSSAVRTVRARWTVPRRSEDRVFSRVPVHRRLHGHALFEGMIYVAKQKNVDVINMSIGGLPALNDGNNARCGSTTA